MHLRDAAPRGHAEAGTTGGGPIHTTEMLSTFTYKLAFSTYKFSLASASAVIILILSMSVALFYVRHQKARE